MKIYQNSIVMRPWRIKVGSRITYRSRHAIIAVAANMHYWIFIRRPPLHCSCLSSPGSCPGPADVVHRPSGMQYEINLGYYYYTPATKCKFLWNCLLLVKKNKNRDRSRHWTLHRLWLVMDSDFCSCGWWTVWIYWFIHSFIHSLLKITADFSEPIVLLL